jgi:beta-mannosidase
MKFKNITFLIAYLFGMSTMIGQLNSILYVEEIDDNWEFKSVNDTVWMPAKVPGSIHTDLLENKVITDPFYRLNEEKLQWIDKKNWEYRTVFQLKQEVYQKENIVLNFQGLDTYANVYINDSLVLKTDNMFVAYELDCKMFLKRGNNQLRFIFESPIEKGLEKRAQLGYELPNAVNDQSENGGLGKKQVAVFSRKPGYHFGWDWGPRLVTSGIWKKIELRAWSNAVIEDIYITQKTSKRMARMNAKIEIVAYQSMVSELIVNVDGKQYYKDEVKLKNGLNSINIPIKIKKPELWWTNGLGGQKLYNISIELKHEKLVLAEKSINIGLKSLKVVQKKDDAGQSFYFELNGHPVFMKGANYIPQDVFLNRVSPKDYESVVSNMVDANYNMIRVWGGGIYEKDIFYDLCDKNGILVWQDFMFACAMYPGNSDFLENVKKEATFNVKRLRNHTCIALWCGNNENLTAWENWGWMDQIKNAQGKKVVKKIWKGYQSVFHEILPKVVEQLDYDTFYWASSPTSSRGKDANLVSGDYHYWGVWGQKEPFSNFNKFIPRFMSEYGFQSFPEFESVKKYTIEKDWDIYSEVMKSHQRSNIGNKNIEKYMKSWYKKPKDFESFLYVSQLLQAQGMQIAIEAHRRNMPYCMGSLYWQINDCWPVASWSTIDYYGVWKASHYKVKELYKPVKTLFFKNKGNLEVHVVSDKLVGEKAYLKIKLFNFKGEIINMIDEKINIRANKSLIYQVIDLKEFTKNSNENELFVKSELYNSDNEIYDESLYYFVPPKDLKLKKSKLTCLVTKEASKRMKIIINSEGLVKNIRFKSNHQGRFTKNYFDVLPGNSDTIYFESTKNIELESFKENLETLSLFDTYKL